MRRVIEMEYRTASRGFWVMLWCVLAAMAILTALPGCMPPRHIQQVDATRAGPQPDLMWQSQEDARRKSAGCLSCHTQVDAPTMHRSPAVRLGCVDCHGGQADVHVPEGTPQDAAAYAQAKRQAHVPPRQPDVWTSSANPERSYTALTQESPEFVRFINPGDLRIAPETCGSCHQNEVHQVQTSLMTTSAVFWTAAAYNNGIVPFKQGRLGESYGRDGVAQRIEMPPPPTAAEQRRGVLPLLLPLPRWEVMPPADNFRVFEDGGLLIPSLFPDIGNPNPILLEEGGKPDLRQSNRGLGTGLRISVPVLNLHKTRLNDPHLSFLGTNDHPGDYRSSGCTACHVVYANDRDPYHAGPYARFGNRGYSHTADPTIPKDEPGHPIKHEFTRAIPSSQCIVCHMHQPNAFVNTFLGYTMWDYETDGDMMWPREQRAPSTEETWRSLDHNPEEAAVRGLWTEAEFLANVWELNPKLTQTQFADYHGHGWNFRAVFKRDKKGRFLDVFDHVIPFADMTAKTLQRAVRETTEPPEARAGVPVHLKDIHLEKGMHCVDCHSVQDNHGNGKLYGEYANAIEIACADCHGTIARRATLRTSGVAAPLRGHDRMALS